MSEMLANRYFMEGKWREAAELYRKLLRRKPQSSKARCRLIGALLLSGQTSELMAELGVDAVSDPTTVENLVSRSGMLCKDLLDTSDFHWLAAASVDLAPPDLRDFHRALVEAFQASKAQED